MTKLNNLNDGYKYRLPTEAEWEYAARAGTTGDYAGDLDLMAWYGAISSQPVKTKLANEWKLYDMHGNVWEWTADWYDEDYYAKSPSTDPTGASSGSSRVIRGGSWFNNAVHFLSLANRGYDSPSARIYVFGFRVVRIKL